MITKTILPLSDRSRVLSYFPGNFRRYFTGKPSCPTGTPILPISHRAPKAQLGPSPLQSNKYSNHPSPHPRRPEGQNPSRPQSATPRSSSPRLLETSTLRLRRQPAAYLGLGQAPRLPPASDSSKSASMAPTTTRRRGLTTEESPPSPPPTRRRLMEPPPPPTSVAPTTRRTAESPAAPFSASGKH